MRAAFRCCDVIGVAIYGFLIGIVILQSDLDEAVTGACCKIDGLLVYGLLMAVKVFNE